MSLSGILQHELELLITATRGNRITAYFEIASVAVLVYDYLLTLKLEVSLIWGSRWNLAKVLFLLTRYSVFVDSGLLLYFHLSNGKALPITTCRFLYQISGWMIFVGVAIAECVLIFRTWAIWGQSRTVAIGLLVFMCGLGAPTTYLTYRGIHSVGYITSPIPQLHSCFLVNINNTFLFWDYLALVAVETVVLVITLIKGVQHYRHSNCTLVSTLYKDGILYYVYLTVSSVANVCVIAFPDATHGTALILMERVFHSIFTARIILHLRLAGVRDRRDSLTAAGATPPVLTSLIVYSHEDPFSVATSGTDSWYCKASPSDIARVESGGTAMC